MKKKTTAALTNMEIASFCDQMGMILHSGISPLEGVSVMLDDVSDKETRNLLSAMLEQLELGESFHRALQETGVFPSYLLNMVEIGEQAGRLENVMTSLSAYYEREESIAKSIRSAVTYPLIMTAMMLVVIFVLIAKVFPIFNEVFAQLGSEMTGFSKSILQFGVSLNRYSVLIAAVMVVLVLAFFLLGKTRKGRALKRAARTRLFFTKKFYADIATGRFADGMSLALRSGLDIDESLGMVSQLTGHPDLQAKIKACQDEIAKGAPFSEALAGAGIFSGLQARMVALGFRTGNIDEVMEKIAGQYEEEVDDRITRLISILEPTLVAVLSVIIGIILLSVMLPLLGILSSIG